MRLSLPHLFPLNPKFVNNMAQLSSVIGSILRDIISAQHEANLYSVFLNESYGKDGKTRDFQLPNVVLGGMELELKYAVVGTSESQEQHNISYSRFRMFINELCQEAAKTVITAAVMVVLDHLSSRQTKEDEKQFFYHLSREEGLNRRFRSFLARNMRKAFANKLFEVIDDTTGSVRTDIVLARFMEVVRTKFLNDTELTSLFNDADGRALRQEAEDAVQKALDGLIGQRAENVNFNRSRKFPELDVVVSADELEKYPEEAIHVFRLKFNPTAVSVTQPEEEEDLEEFLTQ